MKNVIIPCTLLALLSPILLPPGAALRIVALMATATMIYTNTRKSNMSSVIESADDDDRQLMA